MFDLPQRKTSPQQIGFKAATCQHQNPWLLLGGADQNIQAHRHRRPTTMSLMNNEADRKMGLLPLSCAAPG